MEQNRKHYSSLAKAIVIGLQMIAAVVASVSIVLFSTCVNQNMLNMGDLQNSSFVESGYFERTFSKQMMQLLQIRQMTAQRQPEQRAPQQAVIRLQLVLHRLDTNLTGVPLTHRIIRMCSQKQTDMSCRL